MSKNMPLVSILIPAYNQTVFLEKALLSALKQTYKNIEIIIGDDSTNNSVLELVEKYQMSYKNIRYFSNGGPLGGKGAYNMQKCFNLSNGEYINFLFHDDCFHPDKIARMIQAFLENDSATLVTSFRTMINRNDEIIFFTPPIFNKTVKLNGKLLGIYMLDHMANVIGEPTTVMFKKADVTGELFDYKGKYIKSFGDMALWFKLLERGNAIYIPDPLSNFRIHAAQNTHDQMVQLWGIVDLYYLITMSYISGAFIKNKEHYIRCMQNWIATYKYKIEETLLSSGKNSEEKKELVEKLSMCYRLALEFCQ